MIEAPRYQVVTPWWARALIRLGEALIELGERGRWLRPDERQPIDD